MQFSDVAPRRKKHRKGPVGRLFALQEGGCIIVHRSGAEEETK